MKMASVAASPSFRFWEPVKCKAKHRVLLAVVILALSLSDGTSVPVLQKDGVELLEDLESLASSKILMDHTSSSSSSTSSMENLIKLSRSFSPAPLGSTEKIVVSNAGSENVALQNLHFNLNNGKRSPEIMSSLHVAQCRATCLQKFTGAPATSSDSPESLKALDSDSSTVSTIQTQRQERTWGKDVDEIQILPKILRLRRKRTTRGSNGASAKLNKKILWNCSQDSPDCLVCWKSCQLLNARRSYPEAAPVVPSGVTSTVSVQNVAEVVESNAEQNMSNRMLPQNEKTVTKKDRKFQQFRNPQLTCVSKGCTTGCQVACSFHQRFTKNGENVLNVGSKKDLVVGTRQVKILPGKISWSDENEKANEFAETNSSPKSMKEALVYVVVQEYPNKKWKEIAQTTEKEIDIPKELTAAMLKKLRSVSVLVVGPEGLLSLYSSDGASSSGETKESKDHGKFIYKSNNSGKVFVVESSSSPFTKPTELFDNENSKTDVDIAGKPMDVPTYATTKAIDDVETRINEETYTFPKEETTNIYTSNTELSTKNSVSEDLFGLQVVSLIHQKSLVIAELKWNEIGGNPSQDYLITWELNGGGLKGHLVTDSTSVTLSLWPDTKYKIQVEEFQLNLDSDGEQPVESSSTSLKSFPLTVNTSEASFPSGKHSALFSNNKDSVYDYEQDEAQENHQDEYGANGTETRVGKEEAVLHKSIMDSQNMPVVLVISVCATILVLFILIAAAYFWAWLQNSRKADCSSCCFTSGKESHLLLSQDDFCDRNSRSAKISFDTPMAFVVGLKKSLKRQKKHKILQNSLESCQHEKKAGFDAVAPVAVISSSSSTPAPYSFLHCYMNNVSSNKSGLHVPTSSSSVGLNPEKVASSKSLSLPSEGETTALAVAAGVIKAREQHCSSSSHMLPCNPNSFSSKTSLPSSFNLQVTTSETRAAPVARNSQ